MLGLSRLVRELVSHIWFGLIESDLPVGLLASGFWLPSELLLVVSAAKCAVVRVDMVSTPHLPASSRTALHNQSTVSRHTNSNSTRCFCDGPSVAVSDPVPRQGGSELFHGGLGLGAEMARVSKG
jgi:hypothetical protein